MTIVKYSHEGKVHSLWRNNELKMRLIHHNSTCYIPLLSINENDNDCIDFLQIYSDDLIDNLCLLHDGVYIQDDSEEATKTDK